jgi:hypothetical protein
MKKGRILVFSLMFILFSATVTIAYSYGCAESNEWKCPDGFECNHDNGVCITLNPASPEVEIEQRNVIINQFFINENFSDWIYQPGVIYYNQSSPCLSENFTNYDATYLKSATEGVHALIFDFPSKIENKAIIENLIKCNVQQNIGLQSKTSGSNTYIFAKIPQTSTSSDGTQETINTDHILWYNGTKIIYLMYYGNSFNSDTGKQILNAYFSKYSSELVAPPGFFQRLVDFFRNLFSKQ